MGFRGKRRRKKKKKVWEGHSQHQMDKTLQITRDNFIFHRIPGKGSSGKVILATDKIHKESVALKIIKKESLISYPESLVEHHVLKLTHNSRFLTHCHEAFHTEHHAYFVAELASGGDLHEYICTAEVVCGLQFLHTTGIIYQDLKPNNILRTGDGHTKMTDFGLSLYEFVERFDARNFRGTTGYGAPEMIMGQYYDAGVDCFVFGILFYNMILQDSPLPGYITGEIESNVLYCEPSYEDLTDQDAVDIMSRLLRTDQSVRLGVNGNIRNHPFFANLNWTDMKTGKAKSPVIIGKNMDVSMRQWIPAPCSEDLKNRGYLLVFHLWAQHGV
ncbi:unnamed protein product [Ranitomeya imitator]|uniref:Protein kinase domain-containing protein n=1 Tax=Ranitomeya imitator TaxID=111125 RepID=A0ABN9MCJ9_9NEOB|nr:unnamed protein product [Ranitomeya imitator]